MSKKHPDKTGMVDTYAPPIALLVKLGSLAVHADEFLSVQGHSFDRDALKALLADREVLAWMAAMDSAGFLPVRRDGIRYKDPA
jgi:hypothetical protein